MTFDPGMDRSPDPWASPEIDPSFPEIGELPTAPESSDNPVGDVRFADAGEMHSETITEIRKQSSALARLVKVLTDVGKMTIRIDAAATKSFSARLRIRWLVISRATAGTATFIVGTESFPFTVGAVPVRVDLPLVVENGTDLSFTGDGTVYVIADPE